MARNTVYLITGANRGIGKALVAEFLQRPATTVIATVRDPSHPTSRSLSSLSVGTGSSLLVATLSVDGDEAHFATLVSQLSAQGVSYVDTVIANAGSSASFRFIADTKAADVAYDYNINALGPLKLFHAMWPLLEKGEDRKFVLVSSMVGSIGMQGQIDFPSTSYGMSKAAANWLIRKLSVEYKKDGLKTLACNPGWIKTEMGQQFADAHGIPEAPMTMEMAIPGISKLVDDLTLENSGSFKTFTGDDVPW